MTDALADTAIAGIAAAICQLRAARAIVGVIAVETCLRVTAGTLSRAGRR